MFRSLLVPLDGSPDAAAALQPARTLAKATGGSVTLLRVPESHAVSDCQEASRYLASVADSFRESNIAVLPVIRPGQPAREILAEAHSRNTDLIVMATRAPGPMSMTILTSVARWMLANSATPVMLVRPGGRPTTRLQTFLVPVDGSPGGSIALGAATALARDSGAKIALVDVVVPVPAAAYAALPGMTLGGFIDPSWEQEARDTARMYVDNLARHLCDSGLTAEGHVALGDVSTEIVQCADAVDAGDFTTYADAARFVCTLKANSLKLAAASSSKNATDLLRRVGLLDLIDSTCVVATCRMVNRAWRARRSDEH